MKTDYDAIIVGAGPAGSTAAILLASAGWSVALVEKQSFPRRKVCGGCIGASNLPLLATLGVGDAFAQLAGPELREVALYCGDRVVQAPLPALPDARHPWGRALGRENVRLAVARARARAGRQYLAAMVPARDSRERRRVSMRNRNASCGGTHGIARASRDHGQWFMGRRSRRQPARRQKVRRPLRLQGEFQWLAAGARRAARDFVCGRLWRPRHCRERRSSRLRAAFVATPSKPAGPLHPDKLRAKHSRRYLRTHTDALRDALERRTARRHVAWHWTDSARHPCAMASGGWAVHDRQRGGRGTSHHRRGHQHGDAVGVALVRATDCRRSRERVG